MQAHGALPTKLLRKLRVRPPLRPNKSKRPRDPAVILKNVSEYTRRVAMANIGFRS